MDYSQIYFGKDLNDLTYRDIEVFFGTEREENETLEFKSYHPKSEFDNEINNIIRGIDAFLNSQGGLLIWGAPKGQKVEGRKEPVFIGDLLPVHTLKEKDTLINLISGRITPLPIGIKVKILRQDEKYVYVFEIIESPYKPHQFNDRYFIRLDGQSKPAPHYLIEALFKKITFPDVNGYVKIDRYYNSFENYFLDISVFISNFSKFQNEENAAFQLVVSPGKIAGHGEGGQFYSKEQSVLHFGRPMFNSFVIILSQYDLEKSKFKVKIILSFGGKYSPAKKSNYTVNLWGAAAAVNDSNANHLIEELEENILFSDYQDRIGKSKDTFIKDIIGRG